jgi:hypothetical protein
MGPRIAGEILRHASKEDAGKEWVDRMRKTQYVSPEYFVPKIYQLHANKRKFTIFAPELAIVFPWVQYVAINDEEDLHYIPYDSLLQVLGERVTWLDEKQTLVTAVSEKEWSQFMQAALPHTVDLEDVIDEGVTEITTAARRRYDEQVAAANAEE